MKVVVGVTGASGVILAKRLLDNLEGCEVHLVFSHGAFEVAESEGVSIEDMKKNAGKVWGVDEVGSMPASSSNRFDSMAVVPCTMKTLSAIANGYADNLITRAAENQLKMGGKLVVVPRDTPLSLAAIENMKRLKMAGAVILPPNVGYYHGPETVDDITDFIVGKILDCLDIENSLYRRWGQID